MPRPAIAAKWRNWQTHPFERAPGSVPLPRAVYHAALRARCLPWLALAVVQIRDAWFLCDDAFICFRYARNLIEGHGLVWNRGERVEGYTQLAWVLEIAALWWP